MKEKYQVITSLLIFLLVLAVIVIVYQHHAIRQYQDLLEYCQSQYQQQIDRLLIYCHEDQSGRPVGQVA